MFPKKSPESITIKCQIITYQIFFIRIYLSQLLQELCRCKLLQTSLNILYLAFMRACSHGILSLNNKHVWECLSCAILCTYRIVRAFVRGYQWTSDTVSQFLRGRVGRGLQPGLILKRAQQPDALYFAVGLPCVPCEPGRLFQIT